MNHENFLDGFSAFSAFHRRPIQTGSLCAEMVASLTFTTLLSLVPLITIALTLFSAVPVFVDFSEEINKLLLANMMPETGGKIIAILCDLQWVMRLWDYKFYYVI